jgi:hypothetical protein
MPDSRWRFDEYAKPIFCAGITGITCSAIEAAPTPCEGAGPGPGPPSGLPSADLTLGYGRSRSGFTSSALGVRRN